jgi:NhaA family Na+:H+ antiporter
MDLRHWVNEGLMTLFFLVVGLEIKREVTTGELRDPKKLALPVIAAIGGMIVPAVIYLLFNAGSDTANGWGVPVATDIAFALGVLTLAASKAPVSLRSFLLTLAIVDDIGAIVLIAILYSAELVSGWLLLAIAVVGCVVIAKRLRVQSAVPFVLLGLALWVSLYNSGVHPTLAGVAMGLLAPAAPLRRSPTAGTSVRHHLGEVEGRSDEDAEPYWIAVADVASRAIPPLDRVETTLHPWTTRLVGPTFALANSGVELSQTALEEAVTSPVGIGVVLGLVVGKPLGIGGAVWAANRSRIGRLPAEVTPRMVLGVAALAGVGFTVALFITDLAFGAQQDVETAKLAILGASVLAGLFGAVLLRSGHRWNGTPGSALGVTPPGRPDRSLVPR